MKQSTAVTPIEEPWALPEGWHWTTIGEVCSYLSRGRSPKYVEANGTRIINQKCVRWRGLEAKWSKRTSTESAAKLAEDQFLREFDILWNSTGTGTIGRACLVKQADLEEPTVVDTHVTLLRPGSVHPRWLHYWLEVPFVQKAVAGTGSTNQVELARSTILAMPIPIPSMELQESCVARIDELFAEVDDGEGALARAREDLATWRKALLKAAVTGKLTADWRDTNSASETGADLLARIIAERSQRGDAHLKRGGRQYLSPADVTADGRASLPDGWVWACIGDLFEVFVGATPSRSDSSLWDGDVPWVSSGEVGFCRISDTREKINRAALRGSTSCLHPPGTVMLGMIGEGKTRGQAAILDIEAAHNQNCASIRVSQTSIPPEYIYLVLAEQYERTRLSSSGGNQPALNKERVKAICIPLPGASECRAIAAIYDEASDAIDALEAERVLIGSSVATLRQSILAAAFRGDLA